jgi:hypothetical protein
MGTRVGLPKFAKVFSSYTLRYRYIANMSLVHCSKLF